MSHNVLAIEDVERELCQIVEFNCFSNPVPFQLIYHPSFAVMYKKLQILFEHESTDLSTSSTTNLVIDYYYTHSKIFSNNH